MLGTTAGGLFWMFRHLERSENTARLIEAGFRIALTRSDDSDDQWESVVTTCGSRDAYLAVHDDFEGASVIDFLLRDLNNPSSVLSVIEAARSQARLVRTALTREVWEATNTCWMTLCDALEKPIETRDLPRVLGDIRNESALVRGALHGTMMRNDAFDFARLGTFIERADNTARILDVKYYVLLPSHLHVGSPLDNAQWETILRSVSAQRAYRWELESKSRPRGVADFVILDKQMPRSLSFCYGKVLANLNYLRQDYGIDHRSRELAEALNSKFQNQTIEAIFDLGLHEFLGECLKETAVLANQIEADYRFWS